MMLGYGGRDKTPDTLRMFKWSALYLDTYEEHLMGSVGHLCKKYNKKCVFEEIDYRIHPWLSHGKQTGMVLEQELRDL